MRVNIFISVYLGPSVTSRRDDRGGKARQRSTRRPRPVSPGKDRCRGTGFSPDPADRRRYAATGQCRFGPHERDPVAGARAALRQLSCGDGAAGHRAHGGGARGGRLPSAQPLLTI